MGFLVCVVGGLRLEPIDDPRPAVVALRDTGVVLIFALPTLPTEAGMWTLDLEAGPLEEEIWFLILDVGSLRLVAADFRRTSPRRAFDALGAVGAFLATGALVALAGLGILVALDLADATGPRPPVFTEGRALFGLGLDLAILTSLPQIELLVFA